MSIQQNPQKPPPNFARAPWWKHKAGGRCYRYVLTFWIWGYRNWSEITWHWEFHKISVVVLAAGENVRAILFVVCYVEANVEASILIFWGCEAQKLMFKGWRLLGQDVLPWKFTRAKASQNMSTVHDWIPTPLGAALQLLERSTRCYWPTTDGSQFENENVSEIS